MPPLPSISASRPVAPDGKLSRPDGSVFGDAKKVSKSMDPISANADSIEPAKSNEDEIPGKRKAKEVDMRHFKKSRIFESVSFYYNSQGYVVLTIGSSFDEMITLIVNESRPETILVHKNLLCAASPFFEAACKPEWQTGDKFIIKLPEDNAGLIKVLVSWVYRQEIVYLGTWYSSRKLEGLIGTYLLAEKYQMPRLQNNIMDAMVHEVVDRYRWIFGLYIASIYQYTLPNSRLRLFAINGSLYKRDALRLFDYKQKHFPPEFVWDLAVAFSRDSDAARKGSFLMSKTQHCELYHVHEAGHQGKCTVLKLPQYDALLSSS
ncbi:hypothetical protein OCU04_009501 [Sclerotinia nivalis]|uniref:BTB domain-containing protein n=1 Tax=Sclerotinia nivalis TaxID=352851 RepID=A0A9X0AF55_9HELO|nr:hypothetical protein OCU04_009501 [Sclerotinia nivalis]